MSMTATAPVDAGPRVLLVEDEYFIAEDLRRALEDAGIGVLGPVPTAVEALDLISASARIDAAVLDINLEGDGLVYPVADALQARGVPFVFATGYDGTAIPARFAGTRRFEKPFDPVKVARSLFK
jgi:CheY-like chemotaxis protein